METNNNPDSSIGNQGSQDFNSLVGGSDGGQRGQSHTEQKAPVTPADYAPAAQVQEPAMQDNQQPATTTPAAPTAVPQQSQADIIKATAEAIVNAQRAAQPQQPQAAPRTNQDLSPEEFNRKFGVTRANEQLVQTILGSDPKAAAAALDTYGQNLVKQAVLMALEVADASVAKVKGEFEPHINSWQQYHQTVREKALEQEFFTAHPDLANERELVKEMTDAMMAKKAAGQLQINNKQEAFSAVATATRHILTKYGWNGKGGGQQAPATGQATPTGGRQMSAASSAGRSGSGTATAKTDVDAVFGEFAR